jgi:chemotaxis signal transduction protein
VLNEQEFGIIVEETNELLDIDNLQLESLEKVKQVAEKQTKTDQFDNRVDFKVTLDIESILNS